MIKLTEQNSRALIFQTLSMESTVNSNQKLFPIPQFNTKLFYPWFFKPILISLGGSRNQDSKIHCYSTVFVGAWFSDGQRRFVLTPSSSPEQRVRASNLWLSENQASFVASFKQFISTSVCILYFILLLICLSDFFLIKVGLDFTPRFISKEEDKDVQREVFSRQVRYLFYCQDIFSYVEQPTWSVNLCHSSTAGHLQCGMQ